MFLRGVLASVLAGVGVVSMTGQVLASGFALTEQSVTNLGTSASSGAAGLDDISTIHFNPAGLMRLEEDGAIVGAGYIIFSNAKFKNQGSTIGPGIPLSGGNGGDAGVDSFIPNFYAAYRVSNKVKLGLGVNAPFGLATDYDDDWVGRYQALRSDLVTINVNPTVAVEVAPSLSVGAGVNLQYAHAELSNAIDFGGILASQGAAPPSAIQQIDGGVEIEGEDWSWGYNLGILYEPSENTRIGLAYRSSITHDLEGDADFDVPAAAAPFSAATGLFADSDAIAELNLPDTLSFGVYQRLSSKVALTGDITWTNWSKFEELRVDFDNPVQPDEVQPENWEDTVRFALGVTYDVVPAWTLRAGVAYDPTPVQDEFLTPRIPDSDRTWVSVGASYHPSQNLSIDLVYSHLFFADQDINLSDPGSGTLIGDYDSSVDIIGAQVN